MSRIYVYVTDTDDGVDINHYLSKDEYLKQVKADLTEVWSVDNLGDMPEDLSAAYEIYSEDRNNGDLDNPYFWFEHIIELDAGMLED